MISIELLLDERHRLRLAQLYLHSISILYKRPRLIRVEDLHLLAVWLRRIVERAALFNLDDLRVRCTCRCRCLPFGGYT